MSATMGEVEQVALKDLKLDPNNARKHDQANLKAIKGSLSKFGQQKPIVINSENVVIAGNGTVAAAKALRWKTLAVVRTKLAGEDAKAFALADNRTSELAAWDMEELARQLQELDENHFAIDDIGFSLNEFGLKSDQGDVDGESIEPGQPEYLIVISCIDESEQETIFQDLQAKGLSCKLMS